MAQETTITKTAIVTGGGRGLGKALTAELKRRGWQVIIDGRDSAAVDAVAVATGAIAVPGDVTVPAHRIELVESALRETGRLDLLVNNAGILGPSPLPDLAHFPLDALEELFRVNVVAPIGLVQEALPLLIECQGAILNITSDAASQAYPGWGGYGSAKAGLEQISRVLAVEVPEVRVWWFDPGDMRTRMHQEAFPGEDISDRPEPETVLPSVFQLIERRPPSGRAKSGELTAGMRR